MQYALLIYGNSEALDRMSEEEARRINTAMAEIVARPDVPGYLRLQRALSATTVRSEQGKTLTTDGPFVDSKDFLGGFVLVQADNLDGALAVAEEVQALLGAAGAVEVRPVNEEPLVRA